MAESSPMRSLDRAIDVLEVLEDADGPLRLTEIAKRAGLHIATAQRILGALVERRRVAYDGSGYTVGLAAVVAVDAFVTTNRLVAASRPVMQRLASSTGLSLTLQMRLGFERVIVDRAGGDDAIRVSTAVGRKLPLHLGAAKIMAAYLPEPQMSEFVASVGAYSRVDGKVVTPAELAAELRTARSQGHLVASEERIPTRFSIAAAIRTEPQAWDAALMISGRGIGEYRDRLPRLITDISEAAGELSSRPADPTPRRSTRGTALPF